MKSGPGRDSPSGKQRVGKRVYEHNPPGSKVARKAIESRGLKWKGELFHTAELTAASEARKKGAG